MKIFYNAATCGFYNEDIHGSKFLTVLDPDWKGAEEDRPTIEIPNLDCKIPTEAVEISEEVYKTLLQENSNGKVIKPDENGSPIFIDPEPMSDKETAMFQIVALERGQTPRRIREAVLGTDNGWLANLNNQIVALRKLL